MKSICLANFPKLSQIRLCALDDDNDKQPWCMVNTGCDLPLIGQNWLMKAITGRYEQWYGALPAMVGPEENLSLVTAITKVKDKDGNYVLMRIHNAMCNEDPQQYDSLLQPMKMTRRGCRIGQVTHEFGGKKENTLLNGAIMPLIFYEKSASFIMKCLMRMIW